MKPLTIDDLLPLDEFIGRRPELLAAQNKYLDRYRRVRVGPQVTFIFENRQTLWYRVQELLRIARLADPIRVQQELDWHNQLLPRSGCLGAAMIIGAGSDGQALERLGFWSDLTNDAVRLCVGKMQTTARLITARPEDRAYGLAHWLELEISISVRDLLLDERKAAFLRVDFQGYQHDSEGFSLALRQSLINDLVLK